MARCQKPIWRWNPANPCCNRCRWCFQDPSSKPDEDVWGIQIDGVELDYWDPGDGITTFAPDCIYEWDECSKDNGDPDSCAACILANHSYEAEWLFTDEVGDAEGNRCERHGYRGGGNGRAIPEGNADTIWNFFLECLPASTTRWKFRERPDTHPRRGGYLHFDGSPFGYSIWFDAEEAVGDLWTMGANASFTHTNKGQCGIAVNIAEHRPYIHQVLSPFIYPATFLYRLRSGQAYQHVISFRQEEGTDDPLKWVFNNELVGTTGEFGLKSSFKCKGEGATARLTLP